VLELSLREALRTGAREIRTEHIALGVLRADDEAVAMLLRTVGSDPRAVRADLEDRGRRTA
jgi:ATP-dependent Clp protease ATP-binding subunit ClpA